MRLRRLLPFAVVAALCLCARGALAGDDDIPGSNDVAGFNVGDVALADGALPKDGSLKAVDAPADEAKAIETFLQETAKAKDSSADTIARGFVTGDGKPVTVVLADVFGDPAKVLAAVLEGAPKKGWSARRLGHPTRVVVVAGPESVREKVLDLQTAFAVKLLGIKLKTQIDAAGDAAESMANSLLQLEPRHALAHLVAADAYAAVGMRQKDPGLTAKAPAHYKAALAKDAVSPLPPDRVVRAKGSYGQMLLSSNDGKPSAEARDLLLEAVKGLSETKLGRVHQISFLYDLACAYARLGEKDPAFEHLTKALELNATGETIVASEHWRKNDTDMTNLKDDPRWAKLLEKFPPKKGEGDDGGGAMDEGGN
jgi:hypothetical protein